MRFRDVHELCLRIDDRTEKEMTSREKLTGSL